MTFEEAKTFVETYLRNHLIHTENCSYVKDFSNEYLIAREIIRQVELSKIISSLILEKTTILKGGET